MDDHTYDEETHVHPELAALIREADARSLEALDPIVGDHAPEILRSYDSALAKALFFGPADRR